MKKPQESISSQQCRMLTNAISRCDLPGFWAKSELAQSKFDIRGLLIVEKSKLFFAYKSKNMLMFL